MVQGAWWCPLLTVTGSPQYPAGVPDGARCLVVSAVWWCSMMHGAWWCLVPKAQQGYLVPTHAWWPVVHVTWWCSVLHAWCQAGMPGAWWCLVRMPSVTYCPVVPACAPCPLLLPVPLVPSAHWCPLTAGGCQFPVCSACHPVSAPVPSHAQCPQIYLNFTPATMDKFN